MPETVNRIKNPDFSEGVKRPRGWTWHADSDAMTWRRTNDPDSLGAIEMTSRAAHGSAWMAQPVRVKPGAWYRVEAVVTAELASDAGGGVLLEAHCFDANGGDVERVTLAAAERTVGPQTLRGYLQTSRETRSILIRIGVRDALGSLAVHRAYVAFNIQPDALSHAVALPPPPFAYPAPRKVASVLVCDESGDHRPLVAILSARLGAKSVKRAKASRVTPGDAKADAIIIAGDKPIAGLRTIASLETLAADRVVIISLPAFARLAGPDVKVRDVVQTDDPLHACVREANFITQGFALEDTFPFAAACEAPHTMTHRQFQKTPGLKRLNERGYVTVLESMTDRERTSNLPMCLFKPTDRGGVIVFDVDPIEAQPSSRDEPNLAAFLLCNMLGGDQVSLGQFTIPAESESDLVTLLSEFAIRYRVFQCHGATRGDLLIELGARTESLGLPLKERPTILIRTGLTGNDLAGIYGALYYLKQLVRPVPYENPYARDLISAFRLAWVPLAGPWQGELLRERFDDVSMVAEGEFEPGSIAAVIEVTSSSAMSPRVVFGSDAGVFHRALDLLPDIHRAFSPDAYFLRSPPPGASMTARDQLEWRSLDDSPEIVADRSSFESPIHETAMAAGTELIRIEIPTGIGDFVCNSIWRTDLAAVTLERIIGLLYGVCAMNRSDRPVAFDGYPPVKPGEGICERSVKGVAPRSVKAG